MPDTELILTSYFTVRDGKIVSLIIIRNTPVGYRGPGARCVRLNPGPQGASGPRGRAEPA
jgi:hypothetical protein